MEALFLKLANMSITASWLVLAVLVFRVLLKKAPKYIRVILWGLVGLRLVFPFSIESVLSLIPSAETLPEEFLYTATPQINSGIPAVNNRINPIIAQSLSPVGMSSANPTQIWSIILSRIWFIGAVLMVLYALVSYLIVRRKTAVSIPVGKNIRLCDHIDTPFILGIFRPKIYLPSSLDQVTADHVLAHENAHLQRRDHWWKPLGFALLSVYWFNPVMWLAYVLLCRDIELACDEKVVSQLSADEKKSYSTALLQCSIPRRMIAACPLAFGEVGVKSRIKSVLNYKKPTFWIVVVAVIACVVVAVCFLTDPAGVSLTSMTGADQSSVISITVESGEDNYVIISESSIQYVHEFLDEIRISRHEISQSRSEDRDSTHTITLHYEKYDCRYCFNADLTEVWYDNSVKPTLTYKVMNPERAAEFFQSAIEAPAVEKTQSENRLAVGTYYTAELVYWPIYSSYYWAEDPSYRYMVTEDHFFSEYENETFDVDWQWRSAADSRDDLKFFFEWYEPMAEIGVQGIPSPEGEILYQKIDETHHLLLIDDIVYLVEGYNTGTYLTNVSAIYKLELYDDTDVPVTYPNSTDADEINNLYSTISGQIYDSRDGQDMLIRNAILEHHGIYGDVKNFESHQILSEMVGCGAEAEDGSPVGFTVVDVIAVVMNAAQADTGAEFTAKSNIISATISIDRYADGTLKLTEYQENTVEDLSDYDLRPLMQHCYDQAVKYWGLNTSLMADSLLDIVSSSPVQYSNAQPYIEAHQAEYDQLLFLGEHTLNYCFDSFLNNQATGIRAEIMAAACQEIGASMGEEISFDGQYLNASTWFDAFWANALELYKTHGLDALAESNHASWVLLNILGQTPELLTI